MLYTKDHPNIKGDPLNEIGDFSYGPLSIARAYGGCRLVVGRFCSFGQGIQMTYYGSHQLGEITTYPFFAFHQEWPPVHSKAVDGQDIIVGNDVYIGNHAVVHQGSVIGDGAVIGAYSVCKSHIPPYSIAVGNPCKVIRKRFPDEQIEKLLQIQWWNWDISMIKKHLQVISSPDVDKLFEIWEREIKG